MLYNKPGIFAFMENAKQNESNLEQIRVALQKEFISRCKRNSAYSLRAYAKYLEIDQSFLSKLLKGQRSVTKDLAEAIGPKIGFKPSQLKSLFAAGTQAMPGFLTLSDDEFELLSEWHHFAIIELAKTKDFEFDIAKIAKRLGIHSEEVRDAIARLQRLGFVHVQAEQKKIKLLSPHTSWSNTRKTSIARKKFQRELIEKGLEAIDHVPFEFRDNSSLTVAINKERIPEFKEKIRQMRKELADFLQKDGEENLDEVYQLTIGLFPLTKTKNNEGEDL